MCTLFAGGACSVAETRSVVRRRLDVGILPDGMENLARELGRSSSHVAGGTLASAIELTAGADEQRAPTRRATQT